MGLLEALKEINSISQDTGLDFRNKLQGILSVVVDCMKVKNGSIMLAKGRKRLKVIASTRKDLIGVIQRLEENSPSSWVFRNRSLLYVDGAVDEYPFQERLGHYESTAFLLAPIVAEKKVIGLLSVTDKIGPDSFSEEERQVFLDITGQIIGTIENQRLVESLNSKRRTLQKKNLELKKLEGLRTDLFNMLIHDLKGPISDLTANLDILSYKLSDENLEFVQAARNGCDTLYNMVSNLLDIVRLEEGRLKLLLERIDPRELIREAVARLHYLAATKELECVERFPEGQLIDSFKGDRSILLRVLENLFTNAINYSPQGESIDLGFNHLKDSGEIEFFVSDSGPGVPHEHRESIFDKYVQLKKKGDGRIYTTGLGLTFCKLAVEAHGGLIRVEDKEPRGSRFAFSIPLKLQAEI